MWPGPFRFLKLRGLALLLYNVVLSVLKTSPNAKGCRVLAGRGGGLSPGGFEGAVGPMAIGPLHTHRKAHVA